MFQLYFIFIFILFLSFSVILVKNPVISILFLISVFLFSILIFLFLGAEFLALLVLIVYVGAISILFLFVIMMLNLRVVELVDIFLNYLPIGGIIGFLFLFEILYFLKGSFSFFDLSNYEVFFFYHDCIYVKNNLLLLGEVLFNYNIFFVVLASIILFISMIGSIILTLDLSDKNKKEVNFFFEKKSNISF
jgi:NADH-quinone oxidoreductase subunit J